MTTADIRQQVKDLINGETADDMGKYEIIPMTCEEAINEIIRTARGYLEEWGLPPRFKLGLECHVGPNGSTTEWVFQYFYTDRDGSETIRARNLRPRDGLTEIYRQMRNRLESKGGE